MLCFPSFERFSELAKDHDLVPVYRRLLGDSLTPVSAFQLLDDGESAACLFESVIGGEKVGRYSFIAVGPKGRISASGSKVDASGAAESVNLEEDPLDSLWNCVAGKRVAVLPELPPLTGGAIGYAAYDVVRYVEDLPNAPPDDRGLPDLDFSLFDDLLIFDHVTKSLFLVVHVHCDEIEDPKAAYQNGADRLAELTHKLEQPRKTLDVTDFEGYDEPELDPKATLLSLSLKRPSTHARNTFALAISFKSSSASEWNCPTCAKRLKSIVRSVWLTQVRLCSSCEHLQ